MRLLRAGLLVGMLSLVAGCQTLYAPEDDQSGIPHDGYTNTRIDANTVIVNFSGNSFTPQKTIETYLLYRCAKITIESGYDYFVVVSTTGVPLNVDVTTRTKLALVSNPPRLDTSYSNTTSLRSYRISMTAMPDYNQIVKTSDPYPHGAVAVIKMFSGKKPCNVPHAFSAVDVIAHLGPTTF